LGFGLNASVGFDALLTMINPRKIAGQKKDQSSGVQGAGGRVEHR
jgi:hypothetical protein